MNTNMIKKAGIILASSAAITACGGGGSGSPGTSTPAVPVTSTAQIETSENFEFDTSWSMSVDVMRGGTDGYFSLCTDYTDQGGGNYNVDFTSCLLRSEASLGSYSSSVDVTSEVTALMAVLVRYDNTANPEYQEFVITNGQTTLLWN